MSELFLKIYLKYKNPGFAGGSDSAESKGEFLGKLFFCFRFAQLFLTARLTAAEQSIATRL